MVSYWAGPVSHATSKSYKQSPSYLLLRRSRPCGRLWLTGSIRYSPGISRIQRLTCLDGRLAEPGLVGPSGADPRPKCATVCGDRVCQWNRTGRIRFTRPAQVSSHAARVTILARCDFQGSSRYFSERSAPMWRFFLWIWFQVVIVSDIVYLWFLEHASYCFGSVTGACCADITEKSITGSRVGVLVKLSVFTVCFEVSYWWLSRGDQGHVDDLL